MSDIRDLETKAFLAQRSGQYELAISLWKELLSHNDDWEYGYPYHDLSYCYYEIGDFENSLCAIQKAIEKEPTEDKFKDTLNSLIEARKLDLI